MFLNAIILEFVQQRNSIDFAAKMNLLPYSQGSYLDHLGALLGVFRLNATSATCSVRFSLSAPLTYSITIPAGTRITPDGKIYFAVPDDIAIPAGDTECICTCTCSEAGTIGNDYLPGQISKLVDPFPYEMKCANLDTSSGGTDTETDDAFRERIHIAPESFSTAGSKKGYEFFARSADSNIASVCVLTAADELDDVQPGNVNIYVLMNGGVIPDDITLAKVLEVCSSDSIRPDTDYVHVLPPVQEDFSVNVNYWIDSAYSSQSETIQANVNAAVLKWVKWQAAELGRDINPSRLNYEIVQAGAKRCEIISPAYKPVAQNRVAHCLAPYICNFLGLEG